jgi:hypothetical protein
MAAQETDIPPATNRFLAAYVPAGEAFRCPADRGFAIFSPTVFETLGCSYRFNDLFQDQYRDIAEDWLFNLGLKQESWVPDPARFITMHEWGAYPIVPIDFSSHVWVTQWHGASMPGKQFTAWTIKGSPEKFVAPVLFADGHSQHCDFTASIKNNPLRALEPTKDWMWYKPLK